MADRGAPEPDRSESTIAKLRPGVSIDQAQRALDEPGTGEGVDGTLDLKGWSGQLMSPADYNGTQIRVALYVLPEPSGCCS